jgi:hypothetical protein
MQLVQQGESMESSGKGMHRGVGWYMARDNGGVANAGDCLEAATEIALWPDSRPGIELVNGEVR